MVYLCVHFDVVVFAVYTSCNNSHKQSGKTDSWWRSHCFDSCSHTRIGSADPDRCPGFWLLYICSKHLYIWWGSEGTPGKVNFLIICFSIDVPNCIRPFKLNALFFNVLSLTDNIRPCKLSTGVSPYPLIQYLWFQLSAVHCSRKKKIGKLKK
jgi:hypothetical protein